MTDLFPDAPSASAGGASGSAGSTASIEAILGLGAFQIGTGGGPTKYGQDITDGFVNSLIHGPANALAGIGENLEDFIDQLGDYLKSFELQMLKPLQPLIPGATDEDFATVDSAVATILGSLGLKWLLGGDEFQDWLDSIFDPNSELWSDAKAKWDALMALLGSYPPAGASPATVAVWWSSLLVNLGADNTTAATVANIISGNYDWAKTAKANWDAFITAIGLNPTQIANAIADSTAKFNAFLAAIGLGSMTAAGAQLAGNNTSINTQLGWWARIAEDLWIIFCDPFHFTYELGSLSDTPTTLGTNGKRTFRAAQADLKLLPGQTSSAAAAGAIGADVGGDVKAAAAKVSQVGQIFNNDPVVAVDADNQKIKDYVSTLSGGGPVGTVAGTQVPSIGFRKSCSSTTLRSISAATNQSPPSGGLAWGYFPNGFFNNTNNMTPEFAASTWSGRDAITVNAEGWYIFQLRCQQNAIAGSGVVSIYTGFLQVVSGTAHLVLANGPSVAVNVFGTQWAPTAMGGTTPVYCAAGDQIVPVVYVDATQPTSFLSGLQVFGEPNNFQTYWSMNKM